MKLELDEAYRLAANIFGPKLGLTPQEFYEQFKLLDKRGFISDDLKEKLMSPIEIPEK